jgi:hypothetical protein
MSDDPALGWETRDLDGTGALLEAAGFHARPAGRMTVQGLALVLVRATGLDRLRPTPGGGRANPPEDEPAGPWLLAVGVATVDLERPAVTAPSLAGALPDDDLLGARAAATGDPRVVLLEPATEGRLAATLARHGEGPAALYLGVEPAILTAIRGRLLAIGEQPLAGNGPYGPQLLASTRQAWGPHLLLVPRDPAPAGTSSHAWATIER